jgi:predicted phage-related endonuclease
MAKHVKQFPANKDGYKPAFIDFDGREAWLDIRRSFIGGSEAAILLNKSQWGSEYSLHMEKTGGAPSDFTDSTRMQWGRRLEYSIRDGIAEDMGYDDSSCLYAESTYMYKKGVAKMGSTPDAVFTHASKAVIEALGHVEGPGVLEIKNVDGLIHNQKWTDNEPPLQYIIQLQHYMAVMGYEWGVLGALAGGNQPYVYFYRAHAATQMAIETSCVAFWENIASGKTPPIDSSTASESTIKRMHPRAVVDEVDLTSDNELPLICASYKTAKVEEKEIGEKIRGLRSKIMAKVGDAAQARANGFLLKYPSRDVEAYTVKPRTQRTLTIKELVNG